MVVVGKSLDIVVLLKLLLERQGRTCAELSKDLCISASEIHAAVVRSKATGLMPEAQLSRNPECQPSAFLIKPYTTTEFLGAVENVLCAIPS